MNRAAPLAPRGFGEVGPPNVTTFAQIEQFGHQAESQVDWALDKNLTRQRGVNLQME